MSTVADLELGDSRVEFMADYVIKMLKCKPDKWMKMYNVEETKLKFMDWFDKPEISSLIVLSNPGGALSAQHEMPSNTKQKAFYFVKRNHQSITKDMLPLCIRQAIFYGDLSSSPLEQLSAFVEEVSFWSSQAHLCFVYPCEFPYEKDCLPQCCHKVTAALWQRNSVPENCADLCR